MWKLSEKKGMVQMNWQINAKREIIQRKYMKDLETILAKLKITPKEIEPEITTTVKFYKINIKSIHVNKDLTIKLLEASGYIVKKWVTDHTESFIVVMVNKEI